MRKMKIIGKRKRERYRRRARASERGGNKTTEISRSSRNMFSFINGWIVNVCVCNIYASCMYTCDMYTICVCTTISHTSFYASLNFIFLQPNRCSCHISHLFSTSFKPISGHFAWKSVSFQFILIPSRLLVTFHLIGIRVFFPLLFSMSPRMKWLYFFYNCLCVSEC